MEQDDVQQQLQTRGIARFGSGTIVRAADNSQMVINIPSFINNPAVTFNQNNLNYCTDLTIKFPIGSELTPIQIDGLEAVARYVNKSDSSDVVDEANLIPFGDAETVPAGGEITIHPSESATVIIPGTEENGSSKIVNFLNKATEVTDKVIEVGSEVSTVVRAAKPLYDLAKLGIKIFQKPRNNDVPTVNNVKEIIQIPNFALVGSDTRDSGPVRYLLTENSLKKIRHSSNEMRDDPEPDEEIGDESDVYTILPVDQFEYRTN